MTDYLTRRVRFARRIIMIIISSSSIAIIIIIIIIVLIIIIIRVIIIPTAPRIPPHRPPRTDKRRGVMSLVG